MNAKAYRRCYTVIMIVLSVIAVGFGLLCYRYDRLAEGCIVIGATLIIATVTMVLHVTQANTERELVFAQSGADIIELNCVCHVGDNRGEDCVVYFRKNGVIIDTKGIAFQLMEYKHLKLISVDNAGICLQCKDEDGVVQNLSFVCNKPLKVKAAKQTLMTHGCDLVTV